MTRNTTPMIGIKEAVRKNVKISRRRIRGLLDANKVKLVKQDYL